MFNPADNATENFKWEELACRCGCGFGLHPGDVDARLLAGLQLLRTILQKPVHVNSCCRCKQHNLKEGGQPGSQHLLGKAVDIWFGTGSSVTVKRIAEIAETIPQFKGGGIIRYPKRGFCHLDVRSHPYREVK